MNAARRRTLHGIVELISAVHSKLEECRDAEQEAYDNMPPSLQDTEKGEKAGACADALDRALSALDEAVEAIAEAIE